METIVVGGFVSTEVSEKLDGFLAFILRGFEGVGRADLVNAAQVRHRTTGQHKRLLHQTGAGETDDDLFFIGRTGAWLTEGALNPVAGHYEEQRGCAR